MEQSLYYSMLAQRAVRDEAAFEELYVYFFPRVYNFIYARLKNVADADDVTSTTFLKMNRQLADYDSSKGAFSTWLFAIASHALVDHTRSKRPCVSWEEFLEAEGSPMDSKEAGPEARLLRSERSAELLAAISRLSEREQRILTLRFWSGLSHQEIAAILDMSSGSVRTAQSRAIEKLKKIL